MTLLKEDVAYKISHNWFLINCQDRLMVNNVSIGLVLQTMVFEYFFKESNETRRRGGLKGLLKEQHLEWHARFLHCFFKQRKNTNFSSDIITLYDVNNRPMIESANLVTDVLVNLNHSVAGVVVDSDLASKVSDSIDTFLWTTEYGFFKEVTTWKIAHQQIKVFRKYRDSYRDNLIAYKLTLKEIDAFLCFISKQIRQLCREIVALMSLLVKRKPKAILLTSDAHRVGRIVVQIARNLGIRTYVMQHGAPVWKYGYVPVFADKMLVWGQDSLEWFIGHNVPAEQLLIVGNPRFDNMSEVVPEKDDIQTQKIFLLPNPIDRELIRRMIASFISCVETFPGRAIIKPHPSETDFEWFRQQIPGHLKTDITIESKPLNEMDICLGDIAVVGNSTAGIDAILLGAVVVNVKFPGMPNPIPYAKYGVGINAELDNISDSIRKALKFSSVIWMENRKVFLENYLFRLDGASSKRAAVAIVEHITFNH